ncbi:MAG: helix-turn-helix transcriptional regulator [Clostridia bacterium]|nr:helix-turn-helix transcriptional regulator [Clostridia bacterium]
MTQAAIGKTIANLRKERGLTQNNLASILGISNKTVSKWESGLGYPEITQFPALAKLFNVTVDYIMNSGEDGLCWRGIFLLIMLKLLISILRRRCFLT